MGGNQTILEGTLVEVESNNFEREHWWEVESNRFGREHWWEDGSIQFW